MRITGYGSPIIGLYSTKSRGTDDISKKIKTLRKDVLSDSQSTRSSEKPNSLEGRASKKLPSEQTVSKVKQALHKGHSDQRASPLLDGSSSNASEIDRPFTPLGNDIQFHADQIVMNLTSSQNVKEEEEAPQEKIDAEPPQEESLPTKVVLSDSQSTRSSEKSSSLEGRASKKLPTEQIVSKVKQVLNKGHSDQRASPLLDASSPYASEIDRPFTPLGNDMQFHADQIVMNLPSSQNVKEKEEAPQVKIDAESPQEERLHTPESEGDVMEF